MWSSKSLLYEKPYSVIGTFKLTGSDRRPKDIYKWIDIMEQGKLRMWRVSNTLRNSNRES